MSVEKSATFLSFMRGIDMPRDKVLFKIRSDLKNKFSLGYHYAILYKTSVAIIKWRNSITRSFLLGEERHRLSIFMVIIISTPTASDNKKIISPFICKEKWKIYILKKVNLGIFSKGVSWEINYLSLSVGDRSRWKTCSSITTKDYSSYYLKIWISISHIYMFITVVGKKI